MDGVHYAWPFMIPIVAILGAFAYGIIRTVSQARVRELEVRERIALIERGLIPPPEVDPRGFERVMEKYDRVLLHAHGRHRRAGVTLMGVGFGLMVLIGFAGGSPSSAVGVGGFLVIVGLAFFINSRFDARSEAPVDHRPVTPGPEAPAHVPRPE